MNPVTEYFKKQGLRPWAGRKPVIVSWSTLFTVFAFDTALPGNQPPITKCRKHGKHAPPDLAQPVLHPRRNLRVNSTNDKTVFFHSTQVLHKNFGADAGNGSSQIAVANRALRQFLEYQYAPFAADLRKRILNRTGFCFLIQHCFSSRRLVTERRTLRPGAH